MAVTPDMIADFLGQSTPRQVPKAIKKKAMGFGALKFLIVFGLFFGSFGVPFVYLFFPFNFVSSLRLDLGTPTEVQGKVAASTKTRMSTGGSKSSSGTPIYKIDFSFTGKGSDGDGEVYKGSSYTTYSRYSSGEAVKIEYLEGNPAICRIRGTDIDPTGYFGSFVIIFPLVGYTMVFFGMRARSRVIDLLENGTFAVGRITGVEATNTRINKQTVYDAVVQYEINGEMKEGRFGVYHRPNVEAARQKKREESDVGVLCAPERSSKIIILDILADEVEGG